MDDITSDGGGISAVTPSPMSYNAIQGPFVDVYNGKARGLGSKKFSINC